VGSGAAPLSRELLSRLVEVFPNASIGQSYGSYIPVTLFSLSHSASLGSTEGALISTWPVDKQHELSGSAGRILPGIAARVEKLDGTLARFDEPGELVVKTPSSALGYFGNPEAYVVLQTFVFN